MLCLWRGRTGLCFHCTPPYFSCTPAAPLTCSLQYKWDLEQTWPELGRIHRGQAFRNMIWQCLKERKMRLRQVRKDRRVRTLGSMNVPPSLTSVTARHLSHISRKMTEQTRLFSCNRSCHLTCKVHALTITFSVSYLSPR